MKQVAATYQFELSEKELETLCTVLFATISDVKESHDLLKAKLEKEKVSQEDALDFTTNLIALKEDLRSLLSLYNGLGSPISKHWEMSL